MRVDVQVADFQSEILWFLHEKCPKKVHFWGEMRLFWVSRIQMGPPPQFWVLGRSEAGMWVDRQVADFWLENLWFLHEKCAEKCILQVQVQNVSVLGCMGRNGTPPPFLGTQLRGSKC